MLASCEEWIKFSLLEISKVTLRTIFTFMLKKNWLLFPNHSKNISQGASKSTEIHRKI
jgi:hypothetical protein